MVLGKERGLKEWMGRDIYGRNEKNFLLLRGSACPSDNSVRVKSVQ